MKWFKRYALLLGAFAGITPYAQAGIVVGGSRVVYDSDKREVSLSVKNPEGKSAYLIQTWVDNELSTNTAKTPFIITPPLFRLDPGQENQQRIVFAGGALPADRETVFWLNVKSIPSVEKTDKNRLLISVNTRIKLFYRPVGLPDKPEDAYKQLKFVQRGNSLVITNPTSYYVSFRELTVGGKQIDDAGMVGPKSERSLSLPAGTAGKVAWKAINDYGGATPEVTQ